MNSRGGIVVVVVCALLCMLGALMPLAPLLLWAVALEATLFAVAICVVWRGVESEGVLAPSFPFLLNARGRAPPLR